MDLLDCLLVGAAGGLLAVIPAIGNIYRRGFRHGRERGRDDMRDMVTRSYLTEGQSK